MNCQNLPEGTIFVDTDSNTLAYQNNTTCRQNSKMRVEQDTVTYENKHHVDERRNVR